ncbi:MAG TPA: AsmA family protein, partial [Planctomycetaceae bacterium]
SWVWKTVATVSGVLVVLVVAAGAALVLIDWNRFRGTAEGFLSEAAGREVRIGHLEVKPGWTTTIVLRDLHVANADWAGAEGGDAAAFFEVGEAVLTVETLSLLGRASLPSVRLRQPVINAERNSEGETNWDLAPAAEVAGEAVAPDEREEFPYIGELVVEDGRLSYADRSRGLDLKGTVSTAVGETVRNLELELEGSLEERPVRLSFVGGSLLQLRESEEPYPFDLDFSAGETTITARGTAADPVKLEGIAVQLSVAGPSMAEIFPIFGIPLPETAPYSLAGRLEREGQLWRFEDFEGKVDDSDLRGTLSVDYTPERPKLEAVLESDKLDLHDLLGLVGVDPKTVEGGASEKAEPEAGGEGGGGLLPDTPLDAE